MTTTGGERCYCTIAVLYDDLVELCSDVNKAGMMRTPYQVYV